MYSLQEMMFCVAVAVYIAVSLVVAAIRWGHKCQPYARHADYYYPAWKALVACYLSNLLLCPIVFMPQDTDAVLLLSVLSVTFLIGALAPHRTLDVERLESGQIQVGAVTDMQQPELPVAEPQPEEEALSQERKEEIVSIIRHHVEDEQAYLDSHLTLSSLSRICGVNRTYISQVISDSMGGFYNYVNRCRLAHAARLKVQNPNASIEEIVTASGFGSRQSYYNVRRQLE